ncbi:DUF1330 domain-containing protein [Tsuneonella suprasediminis]|uniref:DUF1330 domain-containing protein n=1 Tax=Tsuneonella suprasediminis TaxID=2306996 RepID=UPI002F9403BE
MSEQTAYTDVSPAQGARFFGSPDAGAVVMLNLIRFRDRADYSHAPELEPEGGCSGAEAYARYMTEMEPLLTASGGEILYSGSSDEFLIGPDAEKWDKVLLVRQASKEAFLAFASDPQSQRVTQHRTAAVADSRLLPTLAD